MMRERHDVISKNVPLPPRFGPREGRRAIANAEQACHNRNFIGNSAQLILFNMPSTNRCASGIAQDGLASCMTGN